ncbi:hypothetical protein GJAV_G00157750 [Gymnothorax javanicus]|nr:hypothetical protein GJAV_G00157750 [Gymnothorax javanicus]
MATGGFRSNATTDFLEEWKAKREKMRAKMQGDNATGGSCVSGVAASSLGSSGKSEGPNASQSTELNNNNPDRGSSSSVNCVSSHPVVRSSSLSGSRRTELEQHPTPACRGSDPPAGNLKKTPQVEKATGAPQPEPSGKGYVEDDEENSAVGSSSNKGREKKSTGPSARKGKGQIEKRKLREKRRSTGVVSMPSNESLDELDDDDGGDKERKREEELTQLNTVQNEAMTSDTVVTQLSPESSRAAAGGYKSSTSLDPEEEAGGNRRHRLSHGRSVEHPADLESRLEELEKELAREKQECSRLMKAQQDKDELIIKLKEEIDLLNRDLDDIEDENEQLKQENKTLLKVVGQLTR